MGAQLRTSESNRILTITQVVQCHCAHIQLGTTRLLSVIYWHPNALICCY